MERRSFLRFGAAGVGAGLIGVRFLGTALPGAYAADGPYGALQAADARGIQLPAGFSSRVVATSGSVVPGTSYTWHGAPDGGACFPVPGGGWVYVSNSELSAGGAGALRFDGGGGVTDAYRILSGASGDLFVAEDGGNMELVMIEPGGSVSVFLWVVDQSGSEIAGPAFSPDGTASTSAPSGDRRAVARGSPTR